MNVRTNLQAGQNGTVDMDKLSVLVQELDCQVSPLEMIGLAKKYCKNITPDKVAAIMEIVGVGGGPAGLLSVFGG
jgi:hypothetical protein